ncbi:EAL domain-containing protein [Allohahella marinimesophila]|uniref:EAL domain-containing protein n=1 Tax=Allohahella marinimesophila TaxID=1054972 RepID=A0ABP7PAW8_9GAMM
MKDDAQRDSLVPPLLNVLYVHHAATTVAGTAGAPGPHEAGKFLNSVFELSIDVTFATCPADSLSTLDEAPQLLILGLGPADSADCVLLSSAATRFPQAALIALLDAGETDSETSVARLLSLGATDVIRYTELQVDLFRHAVTQVLRLRQRELELATRSAYHETTGLFSGGLFLDLLSREIAAALRCNTRLAVFCIEPADMDENSTAHDMVIALARKLRDLVRAEDLLAQADASTVLLLQAGVRDISQCVAFADRIHAALSSDLAVRIGIACAPDAGVKALALTGAAKKAAADLRGSHQGGTRVYQAAHQTQLYPHPRVLSDKVDLQNIWQRGELEVYFQPVVNRSRLTVTGFECLLRWNHPTRGLLPAAEFLDPDTAAMVPVGNWLVREACEALKAWQTMGWQHLSIAVNTSVTELRHPRFTAVLEEAINSHGLSFQQLVLEIRAADLSRAIHEDSRHPGERVAVGSATTANIIEVIEQLDLRGIQIALDNVGAGGSTTELLRRCPASMLKLDPDVISQLGQDAVAAAVVHGTAGIAESLALSLVAEGIENSGQLKYLLNAGVSLLQGNFLHAPLSRQGVSDWLSAQPIPRTRSSLSDQPFGIAWPVL